MITRISGNYLLYPRGPTLGQSGNEEQFILVFISMLTITLLGLG
jgi:hypothetical protein